MTSSTAAHLAAPSTSELAGARAFRRSASPLRDAITALTRTPEPELLPGLVEAARLAPDDAAAAERLALRLARKLRETHAPRGRAGLVQGLLQEFALSSQEGVALMCLAEALLRIPDAATRDALIRDKIGSGDWQAHLGHSRSLFVNAATWGLLLTGKLVATHSERRPRRRRCARVVGARRRAADPQGRRPGDAPDGRAVRHRRDDRSRRSTTRAGARRRASATRTTCSARRR